ncbi:MAG: hypothetical protein ABIR15_12195 [Chitinophagaceae bacterium]
MGYNKNKIKEDDIKVDNKKQAFKEGNMDNTGKINNSGTEDFAKKIKKGQSRNILEDKGNRPNRSHH